MNTHYIASALKSVQGFLDLLEEEGFYLYPFEESYNKAREDIQFCINDLENCNCW